MKPTKFRLQVLAAVGIALAVGQITFAKDITVADPEAGNNYLGVAFSGPAKEDNEVENGNLTGQMWDLEAVTYDATTDMLRIISGYNLRDGESGFHPGDIFINTTGDAPTFTTYTGNAYNVYNNNGWEYVVHFNAYNNDVKSISGNTASVTSASLKVGTVYDYSYSVYKLTNTSRLLDVWYGANNSANPWRYLDGGGTAIATGTANFQTFKTDTDLAAAASLPATSVGLLTTDYQPTGAGSASDSYNHYVLGVDVAWFFAQSINSFGGQFTMGCGNDVISARLEAGGTKTPDGGASVMLMGMGLIGLFAMGRKLRK